jgi:hypothetical protein
MFGAEWMAELFYCSPTRARAFCLGAFHDGLCVRKPRRRWSWWEIVAIATPASCLAVLAVDADCASRWACLDASWRELFH